MNNRTDIDIVLTMVDRQILQSYCDMLDGLSQYLGDGYEIVLHSLEDCNHSAIKVINGFHTGRGRPSPTWLFPCWKRLKTRTARARALLIL